MKNNLESQSNINFQDITDISVLHEASDACEYIESDLENTNYKTIRAIKN
ncbi:MAG: hypothetical protein P1U46_04885 [Patescibacteria group bacterium]|nr:hypothetical protein [Patescibacteria group bacterium]